MLAHTERARSNIALSLSEQDIFIAHQGTSFLIGLMVTANISQNIKSFLSDRIFNGELLNKRHGTEEENKKQQREDRQRVKSYKCVVFRRFKKTTRVSLNGNVDKSKCPVTERLRQ